jgi:hypothetical protein
MLPGAVGHAGGAAGREPDVKEPHEEGEEGEEDTEGPEPAGPGAGSSKKQRKGKTTRWNIPKAALQTLEEVFKSDKFPTVETRKNLAIDLHVSPRQVQVWFQNKRQRSGKPSSRADGSQGGERNFLSTSVRAGTPALVRMRLAGRRGSRS